MLTLIELSSLSKILGEVQGAFELFMLASGTARRGAVRLSGWPKIPGSISLIQAFHARRRHRSAQPCDS
jgi:hypothetical protein